MNADGKVQDIMDGKQDGIYAIDKENYRLLYVGESGHFLTGGQDRLGERCYAVLYGKNAPCEFCEMKKMSEKEEERQVEVEENGRFLRICFRNTLWNGMPSCVNSIHDITEEVETRREKERLEQYFSTILKYLPGGVAVVRYNADRSLTPEFLSEGFVAMTEMTLEEAWQLYREDALAGVHPEDCAYVNERMAACMEDGGKQCEIVYRLKKGSGGYLWVKNSLSLIADQNGVNRVYAVYRDMTAEREEEEKIRKQYRELLLRHYHFQDPDALVVGHCNITQNRILEISDHTDSELLETFGYERESFFTGMGSLILDEKERNLFFQHYLNGPALEEYKRGEVEQRLECFVRFPKEKRGRYVRVLMNLVSTPDTDDVTGILTVTDITEQTISERILHRICVNGYDFVVDVDLLQDRYRILTKKEKVSSLPPETGCHSKWVAHAAETRVIPRDCEKYQKALDAGYMAERLKKDGPYTFSFSVIDEKGDIRTKSMTVSEVDLRLGRISLARTDITDSVREQQGLLRLIAYTFELAGFINLASHNFILYTRKTVQENLPPVYMENYDEVILRFIMNYSAEENREEARSRFQIASILEKLLENPDGYDFLFPYCAGEEKRYKQINVMWGDVNHTTVCLVRADVTDMLMAERKNKKELEDALALAREANRAKSEFLSAMSHDIRTPMNAIMGMTVLAAANLGDRERMADCLEKISVSSRHLLSLINDILDMSKIERSQISLNRGKIRLSDLLTQISAIMMPQAGEAGLDFTMRTEKLVQEYFYGDFLRINQILLNIVSNAVKYTPEGGSVDFLTEEIAAEEEGRVRYRFQISDTGVGMSEEYLSRIFEPFSRNRNSQQVEGTGLGLSITKGLVDLMGGTITVKSCPLKGSVFTVELKFEKALPEETGTGHTAGRDISLPGKEDIFQGRFFLIAEDNAINAEILSELLAMRGAGAMVKTDGRQAVETFELEPPGTFDAILMDIRMPELNGYEAARAVRGLSHPDAAKIPIIAMTANAFAEDVAEALEAGMNAHVAKPVDMELLRQALVKVLERCQ